MYVMQKFHFCSQFFPACFKQGQRPADVRHGLEDLVFRRNLRCFPVSNLRSAISGHAGYAHLQTNNLDAL
jgi:hypothetical protein